MSEAKQLPIEISEFTKFYGSKLGVEKIDLTVNTGEVFGFLGANGAGKTTTIRSMLNFIHPTSGKIMIFGLDSVKDSVEIKHRIGYLSGEAELYSDMTGEQLFTYLASFGNHVDWKYVDTLIERLQADPKRKIKTLSRGNRQKIGLIQAFMHKPDLVILDEPTNGLDPLIQREFYQLITETKQDGRTIFLSSHNLNEVQKICDRAAFIKDGHLVAVEDIASTHNLTFHRYIVEFAQPPLKKAFTSLPQTANVSTENNTLFIDITGSVDQFIKILAQFEVIAVDEQEVSLEDIFMHYYE